jgi:hypothetical protein
VILKVGKFHQLLIPASRQTNHSAWRKLEFLGFFEIGTASANSLASADETAAHIEQKEMTMTHQSTLANKLAAAASAFVLSLVLISGTVSMPSTAQAQTVYVGEIA